MFICVDGDVSSSFTKNWRSSKAEAHSLGKKKSEFLKVRWALMVISGDTYITLRKHCEHYITDIYLFSVQLVLFLMMLEWESVFLHSVFIVTRTVGTRSFKRKMLCFSSYCKAGGWLCSAAWRWEFPALIAKMLLSIQFAACDRVALGGSRCCFAPLL